MSDAVVKGLRLLHHRAAQKDPGPRYSFNFFACVDLAGQPCSVSVSCLKRGLQSVRVGQGETAQAAIDEALAWLERFTPWTPENIAKTLGIDTPAA